MTSGIDLHDELFDHEGVSVNVNVDEAVDMAGEDCGVACLGQQKDLFRSPKRLLAEWLNALSQSSKNIPLIFLLWKDYVPRV